MDTLKAQKVWYARVFRRSAVEKRPIILGYAIGNYIFVEIVFLEFLFQIRGSLLIPEVIFIHVKGKRHVMFKKG